MSHATRSIPSHIRQPSMAPPTTSASQSPALVARVDEKKAELESLKEMRELSAEVASQLEALEKQLGTLSDGTEAIALVMGNWHNVLRAINMASTPLVAARKPKPHPDAGNSEAALPQTLVRIPTEHAPTLQAQAEAAEDNNE